MILKALKPPCQRFFPPARPVRWLYFGLARGCCCVTESFDCCLEPLVTTEAPLFFVFWLPFLSRARCDVSSSYNTSPTEAD